MTSAVLAHRGPRLRTYRIFISMHYRCENPRAQGYHRYGGRGIRVCERWATFDAFFADMGFQPEGMVLDRSDNDGNYEPSNCEWVTRTESARNTRKNRFVTFRGETRCISDWAEVTGLSKGTILTRLNRGWPIELALQSPSAKDGAQMVKAMKPLDAYLEKTGDMTPIYYLAEKFMGDRTSNKQAAFEQIQALGPQLVALLKQAGVTV